MASATRARAAEPAPRPAHAEPLAACGSGPAVARSGLTPEEVEQRRGPAADGTEESQVAAVLEEVVESLVEPLSCC